MKGFDFSNNLLRKQWPCKFVSMAICHTILFSIARRHLDPQSEEDETHIWAHWGLKRQTMPSVVPQKQSSHSARPQWDFSCVCSANKEHSQTFVWEFWKEMYFSCVATSKWRVFGYYVWNRTKKSIHETGTSCNIVTLAQGQCCMFL